MVTCNYQYSNCRYHYVYIYSGCWSVCWSCYNEYCDHYADHTNVYTNWSTVSELYCTILPGTSNNDITGTWRPATINTSTAGTTTYTFTPTDQCATTSTMDIVITTQVTPTFTQIGPLCQNSTAPALPATSNNGLPEHGALQLSIHQQLEQLPIHLHQQILVLLQQQWIL